MTQPENNAIKTFTIGCAGKDASQFFTILKYAGVKRVIDVRLYNTSQLAGFAKKNDLAYFLKSIVGAEYTHLPIMAPTKQLLNDYKNRVINWPQYVEQFNLIISQRQIQKHITQEQIDKACLLCTEPKPDNCHRRLVAEYLANHWPNITIQHL